MLRRSLLVECVCVLHGTGYNVQRKKCIHQYVKPCEDWRRLNLSKNPRYTFLTIKSSLRLHNSKIVLFLWNKILYFRAQVNNFNNYKNVCTPMSISYNRDVMCKQTQHLFSRNVSRKTTFQRNNKRWIYIYEKRNSVHNNNT